MKDEHKCLEHGGSMGYLFTGSSKGQFDFLFMWGFTGSGLGGVVTLYYPFEWSVGPLTVGPCGRRSCR